MSQRSLIIFQTWKSKTDIPKDFAYWSNSWKKLNPGFKYVLFDDADNLNFIRSNARWFLNVYQKYPVEILRADAVRYFFLFFKGGIYADMDFECLRSFKPLFKSNRIILGQMGEDELFGHSLPNAIMVAQKPFHVFWMFVFLELLKSLDFAPVAVESATGPQMLRRAFIRYSYALNRPLADILALPEINEVLKCLDKSIISKIHNSGIDILAPEYFYPVNWSNPKHRSIRKMALALDPSFEKKKKKLFPKAYAVTYWAASWHERKKKYSKSKEKLI